MHLYVTDGLTDHARTLADERLFVVFGVICGIVVVVLLAVVVCVVLILRRRTAKQRSRLQQAPAGTTEDATSAVACRQSLVESCTTAADNCVDHQPLDWHTEYSKMINVRLLYDIIIRLYNIDKTA